MSDSNTPKCKCGEICQHYGEIGGYSVKCKKCNNANAKRQREARKKKKSGANMSNIAEYKFSDGDITSSHIDGNGDLYLMFSKDTPWVNIEKADVEAMAKHFGIIE